MSEETELIKERLDLAELVGEYVQLKQAGRYFKALCPFHQEKTPSFIVSPDRGMWHCFGCQKSGDHFSFIQEMEKMEFPEALRLLAEKAGVELKQSGPSGETKDRRQRIFDLLALAARFYHEILMKMETGSRARKYLEKRGVKEESREEFQLGYAPKNWDTLVNFLRTRGYSPQEMRESGLVGESSRGKLYDRFRGRIMFPIAEMRGRIVAFGGRIAPWCETGEEGKYINSPETLLYQKRQVVYNLDRAKMHLKGDRPVIVVEGYLDVVMVWQAGIKNVVASSGTAFTEEAIKMLSRFTSELHFAFDADAAGAKAALMATERALAGGMRVATLVLPAGMDPADVALKEPDKLAEATGNPRPLLLVLLEKLKAEQSGKGREERLKEILPLMAGITNPVFQGEVVQEVAAHLRIPDQLVISQLEKLGRPAGGDDGAAIERQEGEVQMPPEWRWLGMAIARPDVRQELWGNIQEDWIEDQDAQELFKALDKALKSNVMMESAGEELIAGLPDKLQAAGEAARQVAEGAEGIADMGREGRELMAYLQRRYLTKRLEKLQNMLSDDKYRGDRRILNQIQETLLQMGRVSV